jgi:hypothetical protein
MATIDNFQYMPVVGIERLIDPEQKQTDPLPNYVASLMNSLVNSRS